MAKRNEQTDILILGGGIGGYETFRHLHKLLKKHKINKNITLVDQNNFFTFTPLLHEVATGSVEPTHASVSLRELMHKTPHRFVHAAVQHIDPKNKVVTTSAGTISYEYGVLALGSTTNFFGVEGAEKHTHQVRTLREALHLQSTILQKLEAADQSDFAINIVGGGYTGVEIAAEFAQLTKKDFKKLFPQIKLSITLVQSGDTILPVLPTKVQRRVTKRLHKLGISIVLNDRAQKVTRDAVHLQSGKTLKNDVTVWATGFTTIAPSLLDETYIERDRVVVNSFLQTPLAPSLYVVGDMALVRDPHNKELIYPQLGEAAHMEGIYASKHIVASIKGKKMKPFVFRSKGTLIPVGEWYGVAIMGRFIMFGPLAWWMRRTAYLAFMPGWLRRLRITIDWTLNTFGFRHIIDLKINDDK